MPSMDSNPGPGVAALTGTGFSLQLDSTQKLKVESQPLRPLLHQKVCLVLNSAFQFRIPALSYNLKRHLAKKIPKVDKMHTLNVNCDNSKINNFPNKEYVNATNI